MNYEPLFRLLDRMGLTTERWEELFEDVRVIESASLSQMADNRAAAENNRKTGA